MLKNCALCKVVGLVLIIGALNWGSTVFLNNNFVDSMLGMGSAAAKVVYGLVTLCGLIMLVSYFKACPACKK